MTSVSPHRRSALARALAVSSAACLLCAQYAWANDTSASYGVRLGEQTASSGTSQSRPMTLLEQLRTATPGDAVSASAATAPRLSPVREAALRDTARVLGVQAGLGEESRRILEVVRRQEAELDAKYRFSEMILGASVLPAVISKVDNAIAVDGMTMRVAQSIYRIDEPARPVSVAPTWRAWLYTGLNPSLRPVLPGDAQLLPRDDVERRYWAQIVDEAYAEGVRQGQEIFEINLARLERTYLGMRRFYELHARGMVTAPKVIESTSVIDREDPNTVVVGSTVFKIVAATDFVDSFENWVPLGK